MEFDLEKLYWVKFGVKKISSSPLRGRCAATEMMLYMGHGYEIRKEKCTYKLYSWSWGSISGDSKFRQECKDYSSSSHDGVLLNILKLGGVWGTHVEDFSDYEHGNFRWISWLKRMFLNLGIRR